MPMSTPLSRSGSGSRMHRTLKLAGLLLLLGAALAGTGGRLAGDEAKEVTGDLKLMQGTWSFKPADDVDVTWSLEGQTLKASAQGMEYVCRVTLNPKLTPRTIDFFVTQGPNEFVGKTALGIYRVENEGVTFCVSRPGDERRPTEFKDVEDESYLFAIKKPR